MYRSGQNGNEVCPVLGYRIEVEDFQPCHAHSETTSWLGAVSFVLSPTAKLCYGVFSPDQLRCDPVQLQHQVPDKVPEGSGADTL